jgi:hypothetical protein
MEELLVSQAHVGFYRISKKNNSKLIEILAEKNPLK